MLRMLNLKGRILYHSIYMKCPEQVDLQRESRLMVARSEGGMGSDCYCKNIWTTSLFGVMKNVVELMVMIA